VRGHVPYVRSSVPSAALRHDRGDQRI
jgi:hypothetical protein